MDMNRTTIAQRARIAKEKTQKSMKHIRFVRWIFIAILMASGVSGLDAQINLVSAGTCQCSDDGPRVRDTLVVSSPSDVFITSYNPFILPDVLYHDPDPATSDEFYLSTDIPARDTLFDNGDGTYTFITYRNGNVAFPQINFSNGTDVFMWSLPPCSATVDDAISSTLGDTICLDLASSVFTLPAIPGVSSVLWEVTPADTLTGSFVGSGSMTTVYSASFLTAGSYNISVTGRTDSNCPIDSDIDIFIVDTDFEIEGFANGCTGDDVPFNLSAGFTTSVYDTVTWMVSGGATFVGDSTDVGNVLIDFPTAGNYTVSVVAEQTGGTMCDFSDSFVITIDDEISAGVSNTDIACANTIRGYRANINNLQSINWTSTAGTFLSSTTTDSITIRFFGSGYDTLRITGMTTSGCEVRDSIVVDIKDSQISLVGDTTVCLGQMHSYTAMYSDATLATFTEIVWDIVPLDTSVIDTTITMSMTPGDQLNVTWGATGNYMITVEGLTDIGCDLSDSFIINVQDTEQTIVGPTLVCAGDLLQYQLVEATDSTAIPGTGITWKVFRHIPGVMDVAEQVLDTDGDATLNHMFTTGTVNDEIMYIVVAEGLTTNNCVVNDTIIIETIGNQDLSVAPINSPMGAYCAGGTFEFELLLDDSLQTGPLNWSAFQLENGMPGAPVIPSAIDQTRGDTAIIDFPNVADTFIVRVTGTAGPSCMFTVDHQVILSDDLFIVDPIDITQALTSDSICLTGDSIWYAVNIDTSLIDLANVTWSITSSNGGGAIFPVLTGSGSSDFLSIAFDYPEPGTYTHRVRGMEAGTGCEFDEILEVTVKDSLFFILGDMQVCVGDTSEYVLLDAQMMPLGDFPTADSVSWFVDGIPMLPAGGQVMAGSMTGPLFSFAEFSGSINDTLRIVWADGGARNLSVNDSTLCCPIEVDIDVLVRDATSFDLSGPVDVCMDDTTGYKVTAFGVDVDDLIPDSTEWSVQRGTVLNAAVDSITILWNVAVDSVTTTDTLMFRGVTMNGCPVEDTLVVNIRSRAFEIFSPMNVCEGDPVNLELFNTVFDTISPVIDIDSLYWVFTPGDTIKADSSVLNLAVIDTMGNTSPTWDVPGSYNIRAIGITSGSCAVEAEWVVNVSQSIDPTITGDLNTCVNSSDVYSINADMSDIASITWEVGAFAGTTNTASIVSGQGTTEIIVSWGGNGDNAEYFVTVSGVSAGGCTFMDTVQTLVINAANIGQLACNNNVNVTLPDNCELMLTTDQILQKDAAIAAIPEDQFEIHVEDANTGQRLSNGLVDASLIGIELRVVVTHECSGQTCWGFITLEDKTIPELLCTSDTLDCTTSIDPTVIGFPVSDDAVVRELSSNPLIYEVEGFERCGVAQLRFTDRVSTDQCVGEIGTLIYRDWTMTNTAGLSTSCTDTINIRRVDIDDIDVSDLENFTGDDAFYCADVTREQLEPGSLTGDLSLMTGGFCFNVQATHEDVTSEFCGDASFRITRTWTILDWCDGGVRTHTQQIDVLDTLGPNITLISGSINISATDHDCNGVYDMTPDITVTDDCSEIASTRVRIFDTDRTGALLFTITNGDYSGLSFDPEVTQILIDVEATDVCGQFSQNSVTRQITIADDIDPIPICDENTTISIGDQGWAIADWRAFDDGSIDNCGIADIQVRRMDNNCDDAPENLIFGDFVKFCCADAMLEEPILVQLRVTDVNGNINECMVSVNVQDNSAISSVVRRGDFAISCQEDVEPFLTDDGTTVTFLTETCGIPMAPDFFTASVDTTDCGTGTITRNWLITDELGNTLGHQQIITIGLPSETFDPANLASIWPEDFEGEGCAGPNTSPEALPVEFRPDIDLNAFPCSQLGLDHEDLIFRDVEGLCAKVIRTWTLYDWCLRSAGNSTGEIGSHVQILRLTDTMDPVIITGCTDETFAADSDNTCSANITTSATADDCHDTEDLIWSFTIVDTDGNTVISGNRSSVTTSLPIGSYTLTWTAADPCGNSTDCSKTIDVVDTAEPTGVLVDITRVITAEGITVNGNEVVLRATDNCSDISSITVRFNTIDGPTSLNFDCASMQGMNTRVIHPDVYLIDEAGNAWMSHVNITLEDINNVCGGGETGGNTPSNFLNFDGDDDQVVIPHDAAFETNAFTFEAWVNPCSIELLDVIVSKGDNFFNEGFYLYLQADGRLTFRPNTFDGGAGSFNGIPTGQWTHVAITFDGSAARLYINGQQDGQSNPFTFVPFDGDLVLGGHVSNSNNNFDGSMSEVRWWNTARTQEELQASMAERLTGSEANLVALYSLGQANCALANGSFDILQDASANGLNGTLENFALSGTSSNWICATAAGGCTGAELPFGMEINTGAGVIAGQVFTERDFTVDEVEVTLTAMATGASNFVMTPLQGEYAFSNLTMQQDYEISASRDDDYLNGVSTLDLILIQRHILGLQDLDSPYKVIAADVDASGHVSAIDLVHLRRLILGLTEDFPAGVPWTFVDAAQQFADDSSPFPFNDRLLISPMTQDMADMDFVAVKLGDVNGNVQLQSSLLGITRSISDIEVAELSRTNDRVVIGLTPDATTSIAGLQIAIGLRDGAEVLAVRSDQINISDDHYSIVDDELRISWNDLSARELREGEMITVTIGLDNPSTPLSDLVTLTNTIVDNEIYTESAGEIETKEVYLKYAEGTVEEIFTVEQNAPNPFNGETNIRFYQPRDGEVELTLVDLSGRQLIHRKNAYAKGWHTLTIQADDLPGAGIYIYEMSDGQRMVRKKMITIK